MNRLLGTIDGKDIYQLPDNTFSYVSGLCVDADGSPRAYGPHDSGLDATICAGHPGNWWGILTDSHGNPFVQGPTEPAPGDSISTTSLQNPEFGIHDPRRYLDAENVPFVVVPGIFAKRCVGAVLGCKVLVENIKNGDRTLAVCGDIGPSDKMGEASIKVASSLGFGTSPRHGGTSEQIIRYTFYPGTPMQGFSLQSLG